MRGLAKGASYGRGHTHDSIGTVQLLRTTMPSRTQPRSPFLTSNIPSQTTMTTPSVEEPTARLLRWAQGLRRRLPNVPSAISMLIAMVTKGASIKEPTPRLRRTGSVLPAFLTVRSLDILPMTSGRTRV